MTDILSTRTADKPAVAFTMFQRADQPTGTRGTSEWPAISDWIANQAPVAASKADLPLLKLATFTGDYRSDATAEAIHGVEGDYDAGIVQPADAAAMLQRAGVEALIYTTPSHRPDSPRWRVLCPLSRQLPPADRRALVARLNGALGGILAPESFTLSQSFYVGSVQGGEPVQCWPAAGAALDTLDHIAPIGGNARNPVDRKPLGDPSLAAPSFAVVQSALWSIDPGQTDYAAWRNVTAAYRQGAHTLATADAVRMSWDGWCAQHPGNALANNAKLWRSLDDGTMLGWPYLLSRASPEVRAAVMFPDRPAEVQGAGPPLPQVRRLDFLSTSGVDDTAKTSAVLCTKTLSDLELPIGWNEFADKVQLRARVPWDLDGAQYPRDWTDDDTHACRAFLELSFVRPAKDMVHDAVRFVAKRAPFHPVREYLSGLQWDGMPRLDTFPATHLRAADTPFARLAFAKWMIAAVARVEQPGAKVDTMLILEGPQGRGKSTAINILAVDEHWFADELPDVNSKDAAIQLRGKWIIEVGELEAMNRAESSAMKKYVARQQDTYRPLYGRDTIDIKRQTVFAGTTNESEYLRDTTGNRRYWPVTVGLIDLPAIRRDRDQLWAEAVHRYRAGEPWHLDKGQERLAQDEQAERRAVHPWHTIIADRLADWQIPITPEQVCSQFLNLPFERQNAATNKIVAEGLRFAGFARRRTATGPDGRRKWAYVRSGPTVDQ